MRFDLIDLRLFLNVAETGSITRGAERSNLSLPAGSGRLRAMEATLGAPLLVRRRRGVDPTPAGERLAEHARRILRAVEAMRADLAAFGGSVSSTVVLHANTAALDAHLPPLLATFLAAHPTVDVEVAEAESGAVGEAVASGRADLGVAAAAQLSEAVATRPFRRDQLVVAGRPDDPMLVGEAVYLRDLLDREFIALIRTSALQRHLEGQAARLGGRFRVRARLPGFDALCRMAAAGAGLAILPEAAARRGMAALPIAAVPLADAWAARDLVICAKDMQALQPGARQLADWLTAGMAAAPLAPPMSSDRGCVAAAADDGR